MSIETFTTNVNASDLEITELDFDFVLTSWCCDARITEDDSHCPACGENQ